MKDTKTLAYINMYGILGCLPDLCRFSPEAKELASGKPTSLSLVVKDGPSMTLHFNKGTCRVEEGDGPCDIRLPFSSCKKFNGMIDGTVTPFPSKGFTRLRFLTNNFTNMTKILESYLRAKPQDLEQSDFFKASTTIMFHLIARSLSQIGNNDKIGRFSASNIVDGTVVMSIANTTQAAIIIKDHRLSTLCDMPLNSNGVIDCNAVMEFANLKLARDIFDGKVSTMGCVGNGLISMKGNLGMLDNVNRILDRVAVYLA